MIYHFSWFYLSAGLCWAPGFTYVVVFSWWVSWRLDFFTNLEVLRSERMKAAVARSLKAHDQDLKCHFLRIFPPQASSILREGETDSISERDELQSRFAKECVQRLAIKPGIRIHFWLHKLFLTCKTASQPRIPAFHSYYSISPGSHNYVWFGLGEFFRSGSSGQLLLIRAEPETRLSSSLTFIIQWSERGRIIHNRHSSSKIKNGAIGIFNT